MRIQIINKRRLGEKRKKKIIIYIIIINHNFLVVKVLHKLKIQVEKKKNSKKS